MTTYIKALAACLLSIAMIGCTMQEQPTQSGLLRSNFKIEHMGMQTDLYTLTNDNGMEVCFTNFGGRIVSILVPDRHGNMLDVCLGHDSIADYIRYGYQGCNFGALIGRYGNRIKDGMFTLDGIAYQLPRNNDGNCLHGGGDIAFHNRMWQAQPISNSSIAVIYVILSISEKSK